MTTSPASADRFAVAFTVSNDEPVSPPLWACHLNRGRGRTAVTDQPEQASTFAHKATAEKWAEALSWSHADGRVVYGYVAVEAPEIAERD